MPPTAITSTDPPRTRLWVSVNKGPPEEVSCGLLVVACTALLKVKRNGVTPEHGVIFAPTRLGDMAGSVYGYRNETGKTFGMNVANQPGGTPAYDKFVGAMHRYLENSHRKGFGGQDGTFRGIVTQGQFTNFPPPAVVTYPEHILLKAADELNWPRNDAKRLQARIAEDLERYCVLHVDLMGT